jgi:hypothetical protein
MMNDKGLIPEVVILGKFSTRWAAANHEAQLIADNPALLNQRAEHAWKRPL